MLSVKKIREPQSVEEVTLPRNKGSFNTEKRQKERKRLKKQEDKRLPKPENSGGESEPADDSTRNGPEAEVAVEASDPE